MQPSPTDAKSPASARSFGFLFAVVFSGLSFWSWYKHRAELTPVLLLAAATVFLLFALIKPAALVPLNRAWMAFGLLLAKITNPVILTLLYAICFVPIGVGMRLRGRDPLKRRFDAKAKSYWVERTENDSGNSMRLQF